MDQSLMSDSFARVTEFVLAEKPAIPEKTMDWASILLLDTIGIAAGSTRLEAGRIAREFVLESMAAGEGKPSARIMFDGSTASPAGAAFAAATRIDNLDGHDGYNPTKGHIGCAVVPGLFALAEAHPELTGPQALTAMVIAYEIAARAGQALHATVSDYHTSGAWNALGVAALGCRLEGRGPDCLREALGIAEYHGPRSQMMREIDNPSMLHDGSGMGALNGIMAVSLAAKGFKGAPALTVEAPDVASYWSDLGSFWTTDLNYIKPFPICRWAHAAIEAARVLREREGFSASDVKAVTIRTFHEASRLYAGMPSTTSQAQYALPFAVAVMLVHGRIAPENIEGQGLRDFDVAAVIPRIRVEETFDYNARFPKERVSDVIIELHDGRRVGSGTVVAPGGPEAPVTLEMIREKFSVMCEPTLGSDRTGHILQTGRSLVETGSRFADLADLVLTAP